MERSTHYGRVLNNLSADKDAVFEPCTILDYNPDTMLVKVHGINSKQYRDNVPVLFPAMYLNSGVISPPVKNATAMLFWGADNQAFVMPHYFLPPTFQMDEAGPVLTSSPKHIDNSFDLSAVESGEHLIRSAGGAHLFIKNLDEVELATSKLHKVSLHGVDGTLETIVERTVTDIGGFRAYNGPSTPNGQDHLLKIEIDDQLPNWLGNVDDQALISGILQGTPPAVSGYFAPLFELQAGNVYDAGAAQTSAVDQVALFLRALLLRRDAGNAEALNLNVSKQGAIELKLADDRYETLIHIRPGGMQMTFTDTQNSDPADRVRVQNFGF